MLLNEGIIYNLNTSFLTTQLLRTRQRKTTTTFVWNRVRINLTWPLCDFITHLDLDKLFSLWIYDW